MASIRRNLSGRRAEQAILSRLLHSPKSEFLAVYGRRRVGKTFLIRRFFQDQPVLYFEMVGRADASLSDHLRIFRESLAETFPEAQDRSPSSWHEVFLTLKAAIEGRRTNKQKFVLFFDELPWMATHRSGCLRELEHFWNAWCSRRDDIFLIVCGSAASWMLQHIVHARGGLHNRLTQTIRLLPFTLPETREFFADRKITFSTQHLLELYMVFGGIPHYLDHIERGFSISQVVNQLCLHKDGALQAEFERLFLSLFASDERYIKVIRALASKRRGLTRNQLLAKADIPSGGGATTILENLEQGGFITSVVPLDRTSRDRFFRLTDEFSLFHLKWLEYQRPKSWEQVRKSPRWQAWAGLTFESICIKHAELIERALGISGIHSQVSAWLHEEAQIDLLIDRADDIITVCELKFTDGPFVITKKCAEELRNKLSVFRMQTHTRKAVHLVFITSYGIRDNRYANELVDRSLTMDLFFV